MKTVRFKGLSGPLLYLVSTAAVLISLLLLLSGMGELPIAIVIYAVSLYTLIKSLWLACHSAADWGWRKLKRYPRAHSLAVSVLQDYRYNTVFFTYVSLAVNLAYAVFKLIVCAGTGSLWFGVLGGYYLILGVARYLILDARGRAMAEPDAAGRRRALLAAYRTGGIVLMLQTAVLLAFVWLTVYTEHPPAPGASVSKIPERLVFAVALYAIYRVVVCAVHVFRSGRLQDPALSAVRKIGYADALVSLFSLQITLLIRLGTDSETRRQLNLLTGNTVCLWILAMGVYMTYAAGKRD